jgi:DNA adenine methylase
MRSTVAPVSYKRFFLGNNVQVKPLLKWAGGKRHIAEELRSKFPENWNTGTYFEPFIGGAAMLLSSKPNKAVVADVNARLVYFYKYVKKRPSDFYSELQEISKTFNDCVLEAKKNYYLELRLQFNQTKPEELESAVLLYAINKLCFNGLYRENSSGGFNVPFGQKKSLPIMSVEELLEVSEALKHTEILNSDFEASVERAIPGDFIYFDPPYIPLGPSSSFTSYHSGGFGLADQERLADLMQSLGAKGINAMCSNSDSELTHKIFGKLNIGNISAPRMVSARASGRGMINELVITNY